MPSPTPCPQSIAVDCDPEIKLTTNASFYLQNKKKVKNLIQADLTGKGYFHFYVENLPKDRTGCPGWWLFNVAWDYFTIDNQATILGVRGDWTFGDNLDTVNRLTTNHQMTLEDAAKKTWTYEQARKRGYSVFQLIDVDGPPGNYKEVQVVFLQ